MNKDFCVRRILTNAYLNHYALKEATIKQTLYLTWNPLHASFRMAHRIEKL